MATALVSTSTRRTPTRPASRAPNSPAAKPTIPCGAMASPVISGESCKTCWKYSDKTISSPAFHRPSSRFIVLALRSPGIRSRSARTSGSGWCRSTAANTAAATPARASAPSRTGEAQPSTPAWDTANTAAATATVISSAPVPSSLVPGPRRRDSRSSHGARATASRPTGTFTRNTARQLVNWTSTPPRTCPATKPTEAVAPYRPRARLRCGPSANPVVIRDSAAGATSAAPAPCTSRAATSRTGSWARPPASEAAEKTSSPAMNMRLRPNRSAARPPRISSPPNAIAYPVMTHCTAPAAKPSSAWMDGSATLTMLKSSTTMKAAVRMRARAAPCSRARPGAGGAARAGLGAGWLAGAGAGAAGRVRWWAGRVAGRVRSLIRIIARETPFSIRYVSFLCYMLQPYGRRGYSTGRT